MIELLRKDGIEDPWQYIKFYSLRAHGKLHGSEFPITEQIYVHAKLMIVDDTKLILGSANLNDRSLLGSRDSEVALLCS